MTRQKCASCGQFAGVWHKCPQVAAVPTAARPLPARAVPAAPVTAPARGYTPPTVALDEGADYFALALQMEQAMGPATSAAAIASRASMRAALEAQFGSISWRTPVAPVSK